jgi:glucosamine--fructose-6-phosphate aminotransferase (isomerizing)
VEGVIIPQSLFNLIMSIMLDEIAEQPAVLERTIENEGAKLANLKKHLRDRDIDLIVIAARGSSDNASLFGRYLLEITTGIPVSLSAPSIFTLYNAKLDLKRALVIGVSQSGEGVDINQVLEMSKAAGAFTLGITNELESTMAGIVDETLLIHAGREKSVAATKTYTGQMLHFYLLAKALSDHAPDFESIPGHAADALRLRPSVEQVVQRYVFMDNCVVVGRGLNYGNSYELALKLMETCYVVAERFSSADFFHGPLAVVERRFPVILFAPSGVTSKNNVELLGRLKELYADSLSITNDPEIASLSSRSINMPGQIDEFLSPIPFIIPAQLFAALLSEAKGINPDAPRSLSKVTKTL